MQHIADDYGHPEFAFKNLFKIDVLIVAYKRRIHKSAAVLIDFARSGYAYGKQLSKADLPSWELLSHWYSRDAKRVYYLNREIKGADRDSFTVCTPLDAPPLADHLARDKEHFYQNDEMIEEPLWLERLHELGAEQ